MVAFYETCQSSQFWWHLWRHFRNPVNHTFQQHFWWKLNYAIDIVWEIMEESTSNFFCRASTEEWYSYIYIPSLESYFEVVCVPIKWWH